MTGCSCLWCGQPFEPRRTGGKRQRFCVQTCRRAFARAAAALVARAIEAGTLSRDELRNGPPATRRWARGVTPGKDGEDVAPSTAASLEPVISGPIVVVTPQAGSQNTRKLELVLKVPK